MLLLDMMMHSCGPCSHTCSVTEACTSSLAIGSVPVHESIVLVAVWNNCAKVVPESWHMSGLQAA